MQVLISLGFLVVGSLVWAAFLRGRKDIWEFQRTPIKEESDFTVVIDPKTDVANCPACNKIGPMFEGSCSSCGLNLTADPVDND